MAHEIIGWHGFNPLNPSTWLPNFGLRGGAGYSAEVVSNIMQ